MTKPKTKYPIESFGPELMAALKQGGLTRVVIPFVGDKGKTMAHSFQRRIHTLRQRMREEEHIDYMITTRAMCSIFWGERAVGQHPCAETWKEDYNGNKGAIIVIKPRDSEFSDILNEAGVKVREVPTTIIEAEPNRELTIDDLLADLKGDTT